MNVMINGVQYVVAPEQPKPSTMTEAEASILRNQISKSSIDYTLIDYSDFYRGRNEILDQRFHQLRDQLVEARNQMHLYLLEKGAIPK